MLHYNPQHVSSSTSLIFRKTNYIITVSGMVTLCKQTYSMPLRCVIPVVLSNNKNKLMVYMYIVTNTTIFLIVSLLLLRYKYMFRPSMLAIFRLHMKHLTISYICMWVDSLQFVGWDGCEISFCICRRGVDRVCLGGVVKISFMSTNNYVYK